MSDQQQSTVDPLSIASAEQQQPPSQQSTTTTTTTTTQVTSQQNGSSGGGGGGDRTRRYSVEEDDQEDLFVSTYDQLTPQLPTFDDNNSSPPAPVAAPLSSSINLATEVEQATTTTTAAAAAATTTTTTTTTNQSSSTPFSSSSSSQSAPPPPPPPQSQSQPQQPVTLTMEEAMKIISLDDDDDNDDKIGSGGNVQQQQQQHQNLFGSTTLASSSSSIGGHQSSSLQSSSSLSSAATIGLNVENSTIVQPPPTTKPFLEPSLSSSGVSSMVASFSTSSMMLPGKSVATSFSSGQQHQNQPSINTASQISITVSDPHKMGEGMGSYMVYTVQTKTTLPYFRRQSLSVNRRFSDFLGLHEKLQEKHAHLGRIVPPPPAKSVVGTAKIKFSKQPSSSDSSGGGGGGGSDQSSNEFLEKRRAALERYLQRNAEHPIICADPDFREFLELDTDLPRSTSTSALSGARVMRMFNYVSDTVSKMTFRMDESDPVIMSHSYSLLDIKWFESKQAWIENLDLQLRKLYASVESLIHHRKELTTATGALAKSTAILGNGEEHSSLSCALSQLASTHEKIEKIYERQANNDFQYLAELLKDYIALIGSVREVFHERVKAFHNMSTLEQNLSKKRDAKLRLESAAKHDKVPAVEEEIRDLEGKCAKAKEEFETISANIKQEFERFEFNRIRDFKQNFIRYMESLLETQESLVECWESFLPESKSIAV